MAKNLEILCKQYAIREKNAEGSKHFMAFLRTLVISLTIHVSICSCPVQIFTIN